MEKGDNKYDNHILLDCGKKMYLDSDIADVYFVCDSEDGGFKRIPCIGRRK